MAMDNTQKQALIIAGVTGVITYMFLQNHTPEFIITYDKNLNKIIDKNKLLYTSFITAVAVGSVYYIHNQPLNAYKK